MHEKLSHLRLLYASPQALNKQMMLGTAIKVNALTPRFQNANSTKDNRCLIHTGGAGISARLASTGNKEKNRSYECQS